MVFRNRLEYLVDALRESHIEHLVSLIEHYFLYVVELSIATVFEVNESSRRSHDNLSAMLQGVVLIDNGRTSIHRHDVQPMYVLGKFLHIVGYLQAELACRRHYYSLSAAVGSVDTLDERQSESRSLARTGLCEGNKV